MNRYNILIINSLPILLGLIGSSAFGQLAENPIGLTISPMGGIEIKNVSSSHSYSINLKKKSVSLNELYLKPGESYLFNSHTTVPQRLYNYSVTFTYNPSCFDSDKESYKELLKNSFNLLIEQETRCKNEIENKSGVATVLDELRFKKQKIWEQEANQLLAIVERVENSKITASLSDAYSYSVQKDFEELERNALYSSKMVKYNWGCYTTVNRTITQWSYTERMIEQIIQAIKKGEYQQGKTQTSAINSSTIGIKTLKLNRRPVNFKLDGFYFPIGKHTFNATGELSIPFRFYPKTPTKRGVFLTFGGSIFTDGLISSPNQSAQQVLIEQYDKNQNQYSKAILLNRTDTLQRWYLMNQRQIFYLGLDFEKNKTKWRNSFGLGVAMDFKGNTKNLFEINSLQFYKGILSEKYSLERLPSFFNYGSLSPYFKVNISRKINRFIDFTISSKTLINLKSLTWIQEFRPFYGEDISSERIPFNNFQGTNLGIGFRLNL